MSNDTFNIAEYERMVQSRQTNGDMNPYTITKIEKDSSLTILSSSVSGTTKSYTAITTPPSPALIEVVKEYHPNGKIKLEYETYVGVLEQLHHEDASSYGIEKHYNTEGELTKTIDHSKDYKDISVKLTDLFRILSKEPLLDQLSIANKVALHTIWFPDKKVDEITASDFINYINNGKGNRIRIDRLLHPLDDKDRKSLTIGLKGKLWEVTKDLYRFGKINVIIDAKSGKVCSKNYEPETRP